MKLLPARSLRTAGVILVGVIAMAGCRASDWQGGTSGQTDVLKAAPFYVSYGASDDQGVADAAPTVGCVAIAIDRAGRTAILDHGGEAALQPLLAAMNARLAQTQRCKQLADVSFLDSGEPTIYAGSNDGESAPLIYSEVDDQSGHSQMILSVRWPSQSWRAQLAAALLDNAVERLLIIRLSLADYPQSSKGIFGKRVILGTGHDRDLKFVTPTDQQIPVLQITGLLLDRDGQILRAGAEGITAKESSFAVRMVLHAAEQLGPKELQGVSAERREDLPGRPLSWKVALDELVARLLDP